MYRCALLGCSATTDRQPAHSSPTGIETVTCFREVDITLDDSLRPPLARDLLTADVVSSHTIVETNQAKVADGWDGLETEARPCHRPPLDSSRTGYNEDFLTTNIIQAAQAHIDALHAFQQSEGDHVRLRDLLKSLSLWSTSATVLAHEAHPTVSAHGGAPDQLIQVVDQEMHGRAYADSGTTTKSSAPQSVEQKPQRKLWRRLDDILARTARIRLNEQIIILLDPGKILVWGNHHHSCPVASQGSYSRLCRDDGA